MTTIVYQNHVSCFDSQITETTSTVLKLKLTPPPPTTFNDLLFHHSPPKQSSIEKHSFYSHPFVNKNPSFSRLSAKSLELCTECLGSETGSDDNSSSTFEIKESNETTESLTKHLHHEVEKKNDSCRKIKKNFPPPLSSSLQVRSRREDGRLVIEAVEAPIMNTCLQAERCDGRLKLCFLTAAITGENEENEEEVDDEEMNVEMEKCGRMMNRCINGNEELCNWKSALWVATS